MKAANIPCSDRYHRTAVPLKDLLKRAESSERAGWLDLLGYPGIYVVVWASEEPVEFMAAPGSARFASPVDPDVLKSKWNRIRQTAETDIIYVGKGKSIRKRVRQLALFGVGRRSNHKGGEWLWQVSGVVSAEVLMQSCPTGREIAFENWLLETFHNEHGDHPLANRKGPKGESRWHPLMD